MKHTATTHPISWFNDRDREDNLTLQPKFQRRKVWSDRQKSNLIESILLDFPVPEIYMQLKTDADGRSEYIVVDGQQRISAILEFLGANGRQPFELRSLDDTSLWEGYVFSDLTDDQKASFFGHTMAVRYLQEANDYEIEDLFRRLNKYVTPLTAQELRNATFKGPFLRLSEEIAEYPFWSENRLAPPQAIRRMRDIEYVSDLLIGVHDGPQSGNAATLDDYYSVYEDHEPEFPDQQEVRSRFSRALETVQELFPDIRKTRWSNRTDFYSLFVATADLLRAHFLPLENIDEVRQSIEAFTKEIEKYQEDETAEVPSVVVDYVGAARRGSSDRYRRGVRHRVIIDMLRPSFRDRSK